MSIGQIISSGTQNIFNAQKVIDTKLGALVSPQNTKGISGWVFDVPKTESIKLTADITDHYMENNSYVNDHVVKKPIEITLTGIIGELVYQKPDEIWNSFSQFSTGLSQINSYLGNYTAQTMQKIQKYVSKIQAYSNIINQAISKSKNLINGFRGIGAEDSLQQRAYNDLESLYVSELLLTVQTPWRLYENMKITSLSFSQDETTSDYSDIEITLKEMRFTEIKTVKYDNNLFPPRQEMQSSDIIDSGKIKGNPDSVIFQGYQGASNNFGTFFQNFLGH